MNLFCVGLSHHTADVEARERFGGLRWIGGFGDVQDDSDLLGGEGVPIGGDRARGRGREGDQQRDEQGAGHGDGFEGEIITRERGEGD